MQFWALLAVEPCSVLPSEGEDNGGWGCRVTVGAPFIYKSPKSCQQTRSTITARAGRQASSPAPTPATASASASVPDLWSQWSDTAHGVPANTHSSGAGSKSRSRTLMTSRPRDGRSEATIAIDAGTAPAGGCTESAGDGAAHAGDAEDAADVPAEVWLVPLTLGTPDVPRPRHRGQWEAHEALGPHPLWQSPNPSPTQIPWMA